MKTPAPPRTTGFVVGLALLLMSFASGCMDILSYRQLGQVFTSAMTGNAALLGLGLGEGNLAASSRNLAAFAGFLVGLGLGAILLGTPQDAPRWSRVTTPALAVEAMLLAVFTALWHYGAGSFSDRLYGLIGLSAVAMGTQSAIAQRIGVPGIATTYFTGTLTSIVVGAVNRRRSPKPAARQPLQRLRWPALAFLAYVAGAALTGFLQLDPEPVLGLAPPLWIPALPTIVIAIVLLTALLDWATGTPR